MRVESRDFLPDDTTLQLSEAISIIIRRDTTVYGNIHFHLWNPDTEQFAPNAEINIDGHIVYSDGNGYVIFTLPLLKQKQVYPISSTAIHLIDSFVNMPNGENDV